MKLRTKTTLLAGSAAWYFAHTAGDLKQIAMCTVKFLISDKPE